MKRPRRGGPLVTRRASGHRRRDARATVRCRRHSRSPAPRTRRRAMCRRAGMPTRPARGRAGWPYCTRPRRARRLGHGKNSLFIPHDRLPSVHMAEGPGSTGANLRLARQARGFSQQQLASMAGVSRQAVSAVESGHSDPSLRVALALAQALGLSVEELFGPGAPAAPVTAVSVAPLRGRAARVALAPVGDRFVALPLRGDTGAGLGFLPAGGLANPANFAVSAVAARAASNSAASNSAASTSAAGNGADAGPEVIAVRPIGPPRPTLVVAGCDPALPLLATPLSLLDPPVAFAWWPCGSTEALRLAAAGLVHVAGVHLRDARGAYNTAAASDLPGGADVVGFTAWREGLVTSTAVAATVHGLDAVAKGKLRLVNREPGAE